MKSLIKSGVIGVTFGLAPLSVHANDFDNKELQRSTSAELFTNFKKDSELPENMEQLDMMGIEPQMVVDAVLDYFDKEVKMYKLSPQARQKLISLLNSYLASHPILVVSNNGKMKFVIDDKNEFTLMVKQFANTILDDMPFFVRKIVLPMFFGGSDALQYKLNNLDETVMNLKEKQYKDVVFDYIGLIVKRVAKTVDGKMTVKEYYEDVIGYYPNKNLTHITQELDESGQADNDIKNLKYPFKK